MGAKDVYKGLAILAVGALGFLPLRTCVRKTLDPELVPYSSPRIVATNGQSLEGMARQTHSHYVQFDSTLAGYVFDGQHLKLICTAGNETVTVYPSRMGSFISFYPPRNVNGHAVNTLVSRIKEHGTNQPVTLTGSFNSSNNFNTLLVTYHGHTHQLCD